jgi:protein TilB
LNFVDIEDFEESCDNLSELPDLRELFMIGNPCTDWPKWKDYVVARCPTLHRIEGTDISRSWRMKAQQDLEEMTKELTILSRKSVEKKVLENQNGGPDPNKYSPQYRIDTYREEVERKEK